MQIARSTAGVVRQAAPWVERLARIGYAAKGVVYVLVGALAFQSAIGRGGQLTDSQGAFRTLLRQPFGQALLIAVALGLLGYALWRFVSAFSDPEGWGSDAKGIGRRVVEFFRGAIHLALAVQAFRLSQGQSSGGGNAPAETSATVLSLPLGQLLLGIGAAAIAAYGLYQIYRAWTAKLSKKLRLTMSARARRWVIAVSRAGIAARGIVFATVGFYVAQAALTRDASEARGLRGALQALASGETGTWLLPIVAVGLIGYGIYQFIQARYRTLA
jgi:hypothetical protein